MFFSYKTYIKGQLSVMVIVQNWESTDKLPYSFDGRGDIDDTWVLRDEAVVTIALRRQAKAALFTGPKIWKRMKICYVL